MAKRMKKEWKAVVCVLTLALFLTGCLSEGLYCNYYSESGAYKITFQHDGTCTWYQGDRFFEGTYERSGDGWRLEISGDGGLYSNTVFYATPDSGELIIEGGIVHGERFAKDSLYEARFNGDI